MHKLCQHHVCPCKIDRKAAWQLLTRSCYLELDFYITQNVKLIDTISILTRQAYMLPHPLSQAKPCFGHS